MNEKFITNDDDFRENLIERIVLQQPLTLAFIKNTIDEIKTSGNDTEEHSHQLEDSLRHAVLVAIAEGASNSYELAKEVLKTTEIKFHRYCV